MLWLSHPEGGPGASAEVRRRAPVATSGVGVLDRPAVAAGAVMLTAMRATRSLTRGARDWPNWSIRGRPWSRGAAGSAGVPAARDRHPGLPHGDLALARTVGWIAQLNEMIGDPEYKIGRPRQLYTGAPPRQVKAVAQRG
jgi:hypothetical protein